MAPCRYVSRSISVTYVLESLVCQVNMIANVTPNICREWKRNDKLTLGRKAEEVAFVSLLLSYSDRSPRPRLPRNDVDQVSLSYNISLLLVFSCTLIYNAKGQVLELGFLSPPFLCPPSPTFHEYTCLSVSSSVWFKPYVYSDHLWLC